MDASDARALAERVGRVGLWTRHLDAQPIGVVRDTMAELETLGWRTLWFWEVFGREALSSAALLLGATERMVVGSGIATTWGRDPVSMANAQRTLAEAFPDRFVLGMGISHAPLAAARGHAYDRPVERMSAYLDAMDAAPYEGPPRAEASARVLAALGPRMLALAGARTAGALTYNTPPAATAAARAALGPEPLLAVEQAVLLSDDPDRARAIAREFIAFYLTLPNYTRSWARAGFGPDDLAAPGSDRLLDAVVAWGDPDRIRARVQEHLDAGADHVCIQAIDADPAGVPIDTWRTLAPALADMR